MNRTIITNSLNDIDDRFIEEAAGFKAINKKTLVIKLTALAACLCLVAAVALKVYHKPGINKDTVITGKDKYIMMTTDEALQKRNQVYISDLLRENMEKYKTEDVLFGVVVEIILTTEDYDEFTPSEELNRLMSERMAASQAHTEAWEAYETARKGYFKGTVSEQQLSAALNEAESKKEIMRKKSNEYDELNRSEYDAYKNAVSASRLDYLNTISGKQATEIPGFYSEPGVYDEIVFIELKNTYYAELSREMINELAVEGGYAFKLSVKDYHKEFMDE